MLFEAVNRMATAVNTVVPCTIFMPDRGTAPGDYAWIEIVSFEETGPAPDYAVSGTLSFMVELAFQSPDTQADAERILNLVDQTKSGSVQQALQGTDDGKLMNIGTVRFGRDRVDGYRGAQINVIVLIGGDDG